MSQTNVKDYVELSKSKRIIAFLSISVIYFFYCYNFSITAIYQPILIDNYGFSASELSNAFAMMSFGTLFGTIIAGLLASKLNKKLALIIMALGFTIPTFLHILTFQSYNMWVLLRFIAGTSLGGIFGTSVALICDMFPQKYRGRLTSIASSLFALAFSFGFTISKLFQSTNQYMVLLIGSIMPLIGIILTILFVPNTDKILEENKEKLALENNLEVEEEKKPGYLQFIKSAPLFIIIAVFLSGMNFTGYSGFTNNASLFIGEQINMSVDEMVEDNLIEVKDDDYIYNDEKIVIVKEIENKKEEITVEAGDTISYDDAVLISKSIARSEAAGAMSNVGNGHFIGFIIFGFIGDYFGRKKNIIGMLISASAAAGILLISYNGSIMPYTILGILMGFGFGYSGVWGAYYSELFDSKYRGMAAGFCFNMGRIISMFSVPFIGRMVDSMGVSKALWIPIGAFVLGAIAWGFLPETLNKKKL